MRTMLVTLGLLLAAAVAGAADSGACSAGKPAVRANYSGVLAASRKSGIAFTDLPGFTRSAYFRDHALITPESRVWGPHPGWSGSLVSFLMSPASGSLGSMYLVEMKEGGLSPAPPQASVERFVLVLEGSVQVTPAGSAAALELPANHYLYFPPNSTEQVASAAGASLLVWERVYAAKGSPVFQHGFVEDSPLLPTPGEVFELRKLLPQTTDYDFNIHVMDFQPGEHLYVKEIHYNQHGLMMLEGQGIYRLGDAWYPVQAGDAVWMAPYVIQWYAALGKTRTRYIISKDVTVDPLFSV